MNKQKISIILLAIFLITVGLTLANAFLSDSNTVENKTGTITIDGKTVNYENAGKCLEVIDGNTIQVYGVGKVQLVQIKTPDLNQSGFSDSKKFVEDKCLGKTVYLDIDDKQPKDKYGRTLAIVYTDTEDINKELINNNLAKISYFEPSEFKKGEV
jgi:micrococcal nuclease